MFERFTVKARDVVVGAQQQARDRGAGLIRSEHLLVALVRLPEALSSSVLTAFAIDAADIIAAVDRLDTAPLDADALASIGIDLDEVRRQAEETFGPGALERTRAAR